MEFVKGMQKTTDINMNIHMAIHTDVYMGIYMHADMQMIWRVKVMRQHIIIHHPIKQTGREVPIQIMGSRSAASTNEERAPLLQQLGAHSAPLENTGSANRPSEAIESLGGEAP